MNKAELVAAVAAKTGETKKAAESTVNAFVEVITEALAQGDKIQLALVESSDVAAWVSASADTVTGKIIRVCALIISIMICISSVYFLYRLLLQDMGYLLEVLRMK